MKTLQIINSAYRCTIEEQDDPVVWITHAMKGAGAELDTLLRGNAVNYAVEKQSVSQFSIGGVEQTQPPNLPRDIMSLRAKGISVLLVEEDCRERGLTPEDLLEGMQFVSRAQLATLFEQYDQVWNW
jgi:sulfur relay (sulfurtransferase) DsrF/TusC family protein